MCKEYAREIGLIEYCHGPSCHVCKQFSIEYILNDRDYR